MPSASETWQSIRRLVGGGNHQQTAGAIVNEDETTLQYRFHTLLDAFMAEQDGILQHSTPDASHEELVKRNRSAPTSNEDHPNSIDQRDSRGSKQSAAHDLMPEEMAQQIEEFLMELSSCYQVYGCPTHVIEVNMPKVAKGLGMEVDFAVFPTHTLISITRQKSDGSKRKITQYFNTGGGLNMYKLQLVDELVRRIASYATKEPPKVFNIQPPTLTLGMSKQSGN
jgi:hypothetical protein